MQVQYTRINVMGLKPNTKTIYGFLFLNSDREFQNYNNDIIGQACKFMVREKIPLATNSSSKPVCFFSVQMPKVTKNKTPPMMVWNPTCLRRINLSFLFERI